MDEDGQKPRRRQPSGRDSRQRWRDAGVITVVCLLTLVVMICTVFLVVRTGR